MVEVSGLTKKYGPIRAVTNISFSVNPGEICGFLGPNGAGKSTTLNIITGCLSATGGNVKIGGYDILEESAKAKALLGYLPENPPVYPSLTPREYLRFVAQAKSIKKTDVKKEIERVMEKTALTEMADRLTENLSKGYRHRLGLAQALLGKPKLIVLDEPTVGLDPKQIAETRKLIKSLKGEHTIILSSHILSEISALCDKVVIISKGELLACDTPDNLEKLLSGKWIIEAVIECDINSGKSLTDRISAITGSKKSDVTVTEDNQGIKINIQTAPGRANDVTRAVFDVCSSENAPIVRLNTIKASLEDVFLELTK